MTGLRQRTIVIVLIIGMIAGVLHGILCIPSYAADSDVDVIDFSDTAIASLAKKTNVNYSEAQGYAGAAGALKLTVPTADKNVESARFSFAANGIITDWSDVDEISFVIYSESANDEKLHIVFTKSQSTINDGYYRYCLTVDWEGWKKITVSRSDFSPAKGIASSTGWSEIDSLYFNVGGWTTGSKTSTVLYFALVDASDEENLILSTIPDSVGIYDGENTAIVRSVKTTLSFAPICKSGILFVPLGIMDELLGFVVDGTSVEYDGLIADFAVNSDKVQVGSYTYTMCGDTYSDDKNYYVPLCDICKIYDIPIMIDNRFAVFGSDDDITALRSYKNYGVNHMSEKIITYLTSNQSDSYTISDCESVIENWLSNVVGNKTLNDTSDSDIKRKITSINNSASEAWSKFIRDEGQTELFDGITTTTTAHMTTAAGYLYDMAAGYGAYGSTYYGNDELLSDILYGIDWFYEHRYGENEALNNENAWRDRTLYNWYDWRIGTPEYWIPTLMIVRDELTNEQISTYLTCFNASVPTTSSSGSNYIHISKLIIGAAALEGNGERVKEYAQDAEKTFIYVDDGRNPESQLDSSRAAYTPNKGHGFYKDGSYVYHTLHAMNGSYGLSHARIASDLLALLSGTPFEMPDYCTDNMADWIINSFDALTYKNRMPRMVLGRKENPDEISQVRTVVGTALKCFKDFNVDDRQIIGSMIKEYVGDKKTTFISSIAIANLDILAEILSSDLYNSYNYEKSNVFANMDKAMHRRDGWAVGLSMSSSRMFNYESINGANKTGWYLGDGMTELILEDNSVSSATNYWTYIDYYRLPGTTVDNQPRQEVSIAQGNEYLSTKDFVGGAELDNKYITAAMHLESYHNDTAYGVDKGSYGTYAPAHTSDLTAKKSYFAFDNELYCLGAEINASDNNNADVLTVVENRIIKDKIESNAGDVTLSAEDSLMQNIIWLNADDEVGYYFPPENTASLNVRKNDNTNVYFEAILHHGINPSNASYAYALLPGMTSEQTAAYATSPEVEILANTESVQAVKNKTLGITSMVFWEAGTFGGITVSEPMIVMVKENGNLLTLAVSDPTQKLTSAAIKFNRHLLLTDSGERITQSSAGETSSFTLDFAGSLGSTIQANLRQNDPVLLKLSLADSDGNEYNRYLAHKQALVNASVTMVNLSGQALDVIFVIAMYSSDGILQDVHTREINVSAFSTEQMNSVTLKPDADTALIKGFVWQEGTLKPFDSIYLNN